MTEPSPQLFRSEQLRDNQVRGRTVIIGHDHNHCAPFRQSRSTHWSSIQVDMRLYEPSNKALSANLRVWLRQGCRLCFCRKKKVSTRKPLSDNWWRERTEGPKRHVFLGSETQVWPERLRLTTPWLWSSVHLRSSCFVCDEKCIGGQRESTTSGNLTQISHVRYFLTIVYWCHGNLGEEVYLHVHVLLSATPSLCSLSFFFPARRCVRLPCSLRVLLSVEAYRESGTVHFLRALLTPMTVVDLENSQRNTWFCKMAGQPAVSII